MSVRTGPRSRALVAGLAATSALLCLVAGCTSADPKAGAPAPDDAPSSSTPTSGPTSEAPSTTPEEPLIEPSHWAPTRREWRRAVAAARQMTVPELAGGVIMASYEGSRPPVRLVRRLDLGGVIVGSENVASTAAQAAANRRLQQSVKGPWPLAIAVDQEGGRVSRLGSPVSTLPSYMSLGAADRLGLARRAAELTGTQLRRAGFTMVMAPVADVTIGARDTAIGSRSAGSDPAAVAKVVVASLRGFDRAGIVPVVKHFPGHGSVTVDSHVGLPRQQHSTGWLARRDFVPFRSAIEARVSAVMVGHIALSTVDRGVPADLSARSVGLLRDDLGFGGLVVSDSLQMAAVTKQYGSGRSAVAALRAGVDVVLMPPDPAKARAAVVDAVRAGTLSRSRLEASVARIGALMLHERRSAVPRTAKAADQLPHEISAAALTVVSGACKGPYVAGSVKPVGPRWLVKSFRTVARAHGLRVDRGPRLLLVDSTTRLRPATIAVAVDTPYRLAGLSGVPTRLALYGSSATALDALVDVLTGRSRAPGRLPVRVTAPGCG